MQGKANFNFHSFKLAIAYLHSHLTILKCTEHCSTLDFICNILELNNIVVPYCYPPNDQQTKPIVINIGTYVLAIESVLK